MGGTLYPKKSCLMKQKVTKSQQKKVGRAKGPAAQGAAKAMGYACCKLGGLSPQKGSKNGAASRRLYELRRQRVGLVAG